MSQPKHGSAPKCDRALELHEKGISFDAISERLGLKRREISSYIKTGLARRAKLMASAEQQVEP